MVLSTEYNNLRKIIHPERLRSLLFIASTNQSVNHQTTYFVSTSNMSTKILKLTILIDGFRPILFSIGVSNEFLSSSCIFTNIVQK